MPEYSVSLTKTARKQLDKLPNSVAEPLLDAIKQLSFNPRPNGCKKLKGRDGYRIRKGNYRILYDIFDDKLIVIVIGIGDRKEVYR